jgi:isoleucyl-tRNA synthetase
MHIHMGTAANKIKDAVVRQASDVLARQTCRADNHGMPIEVQAGREFRERGET